MRRRLSSDVLLLLTVLIWGFNFTAVKYLLEHGFEPLAYSSTRFAAAAAIFGAYTYRREGTFAMSRRDLALVGGAAAVGIWLNQISFVYAITLTTATTVALLFGTLPVFVALIARAFGVERLSARHWLATGVSFAGVGLVAVGGGGALAGHLGGVLLGVATALTWAAYSVAVGPLMRRYSVYRISAIVLVAGSVPLVASASGQLARQDWSQPDALAWAAFGFSLLFALVLTNIFWFTAIERVGASRSALYANLQPFVGALFALLILSEDLSALQLAGGVVIAAGIVLARRPAATESEAPRA